MSTRFNAYREWLGLPAEPDDCQLLGVDPSERDEAEIARAAKRVLDRLRQIDPGERRPEWEALIGRVKQARRRLVERAAAEPQPSPAVPLPTPLDPMAPYIPARAAGGPPLPGEAAGASPSAPPAVPPLAAATPIRDDFPPRYVRRRRAPRNRLPRAWLAAALALLLALTLAYLGRDRLHQTLAGAPPAPLATTGSGPESGPSEPAGSRQPPTALPIELLSDAPPSDALPNDPPDDPLPADGPGMVADGSAADESPSRPEADVGAPPLELSDEQLAALEAGIESAWSALRQKQFAEAQRELERLQPLAEQAGDRRALERVEAVARYAAEFDEAIRRAARRLEAAETLTVGENTVVAVVQASDERIVVRVAGQNRRYALRDMPLELALTIGERAAPADAEHWLLMKASWVAIHPAARAEQLARARSWCAEAGPAGELLLETLQNREP